MKTEELVLVIVISMAILFLVSGFFGNWNSGSGMMGMMGGFGGFGFMWLFGWLFMTLITIALVLGIIWLTKQIQKK